MRDLPRTCILSLNSTTVTYGCRSIVLVDVNLVPRWNSAESQLALLRSTRELGVVTTNVVDTGPPMR